MIKYKELWFLRHPEVDKSEGFPLTGLGKKHAHMLGWHMASSELLYPALILQTEAPRTKTTANILADSILEHDRQAGKIEQAMYSLPEDLESGLAKLIHMTHALGNLPNRLPEEIPNTAIFVIQARHQAALMAFSYFMSSQLAKTLSEHEDPPEAGLIEATQELCREFAPRQFTNCEIWRMRFPIAQWNELFVGSGSIVSHETLETIEPAYEAWRRGLKAMATTPAVAVPDHS